MNQRRQEKQTPIPFEPMIVMRDNQLKKCSEFKRISHEKNDDKSGNISKLAEDELRTVMEDAQISTSPEQKEEIRTAKLAMTESFLLKETKMVKIVLDEPLPSNAVFTATETGVEGLECEMSGGSSSQEGESKEAFMLMTNTMDFPMEIEPALSDVHGGIDSIEDECKIYKSDGAGIFTVQEVCLRESFPSSVDTEETSSEHEKMGVQIRDWRSQIEWIPTTKEPVVIFFAGIGGTTRGFQIANEIYGTSFLIYGVINDNDEIIRVHKTSFPTIPVLKWTLRRSQQKTLEAVDRHNFRI